MKIALVYDRVNKIGGAERVLQSLHELYPHAPLYTAVYHEKNAPWARGWDLKTSFVNSMPLARSTHELYPWLMPIAFESFDFSSFDVVVSVTSAEAKGILTQPHTLHICYCLTPTRYLWIDHELHRKAVSWPLRPLSNLAFSYLKTWDKIAGNRPDHFIAISKTVRRRIKIHYGRESQYIYPPVNVEKFSSQTIRKPELEGEDFFLIVSRLVPYKRIRVAIEAANRLKLPLVIVGTGIAKRKLQRLAGPTVRFVGKLTDRELVLYYQRCRALIFPQEEDFGIAIVEAQAAGKPVIAFNKGGATEIIRTGKSGVFFSHQTVDSLVKAIQEYDSMRFSPTECLENAKRFAKERFITEFRRRMEELWEEHKQRSAQ